MYGVTTKISWSGGLKVSIEDTYINTDKGYLPHQLTVAR